MTEKYRTPQLKEFVKGFKYQANIGYKWEDVEYPITGFDGKNQLKLAIVKKLVRVKEYPMQKEIFIRVKPKDLFDSTLVEGEFVDYQGRVYKFKGWEYGHTAYLTDIETNGTITVYY